MLNATILKDELKPLLKALWQTGFEGQGMSVDVYAEQFAQILAEKIVNHIKENAVVRLSGGQAVLIPPAPVPPYTSALTSPAGPVIGNIVLPGEGSELIGWIE